MFSRFIITNTMLDFLVFLLDIPSLLADFSPRAKHKGESPYWRFMGLFLLTAELVILFLWDITESPPALVACITLGLWLIAHLSKLSESITQTIMRRVCLQPICVR